MENKNGETKEQALLNGTYDRLEFMLGGYNNGMSGLLGTSKQRWCRYCSVNISDKNKPKCNTYNEKHIWTY